METQHLLLYQGTVDQSVLLHFLSILQKVNARIDPFFLVILSRTKHSSSKSDIQFSASRKLSFFLRVNNSTTATIRSSSKLDVSNSIQPQSFLASHLLWKEMITSRSFAKEAKKSKQKEVDTEPSTSEEVCTTDYPPIEWKETITNTGSEIDHNHYYC